MHWQSLAKTRENPWKACYLANFKLILVQYIFSTECYIEDCRQKATANSPHAFFFFSCSLALFKLANLFARWRTSSYFEILSWESSLAICCYYLWRLYSLMGTSKSSYWPWRQPPSKVVLLGTFLVILWAPHSLGSYETAGGWSSSMC